MKKITQFTLLLASCLIFSQPDINITAFGPAFESPIAIKHAGDTRLFIVEQDGYIQILNQNGSANPQPFLDIDALVTNGGGERGLLGLAFHPNYATNGYFYVNYINNSGNTVISRFSRSTADADLANPSSELVLLTITQPYTNHNGGDMAFGQDGYLYIAMGDGGSGGDPDNYGQNLNSLLGKMLRIDVNSGSPYSIPADNPFLNDGNPNTLPEIWAYGLRNPWKFSFDSDTGDMWIGDVGQGQYEEINMVGPTAAGINYGWRCYEGNHVYNSSGCPAMNTLTFPVGEYSHNSSGAFKCSITGGYRYRGSMFSNFDGLYFFADYCSNEIGYLEYDGTDWNMTLTGPFGGNNWSSFGEDVNGELYIAGISSGHVYKIVDDNLSVGENPLQVFSMYPNPANDAIHFTFTDGNSLKAISLFNMAGQRVKYHETQLATADISVKELNKGIYFVECETDNAKFVKKLAVY
ncbi:MAG TPA: PQQ-dependent sugar dehydrogenase [Flavobacteriaceae bacterium]|nr:PQQ-dependent sugar dehydrogenase [Flavobacteriaceae bacterium]